MKKPFELCLNFFDQKIGPLSNQEERVEAKVQLTLTDADSFKEESDYFTFISPISLFEIEELKWYLESYYIWPVGLFKERASKIEQELPLWGENLVTALMQTKLSKEIFEKWLGEHEKVFTINVQLSDSTKYLKTASHLLGIPWELLRKENQYLIAHDNPISIRRNFKKTHTKTLYNYNSSKIRVISISPRPSEAGFFDHRSSIKPLIEAVESLGDRLDLVIVHPPTMTKLKEQLENSKFNGAPIHAIHFDGHGIFNKDLGKGALCFEHPLDDDKHLPEVIDLVYADEFSKTLSEYNVPLVFLEACQTAQSDIDPTTSVAASLLQQGVSSVIAMSYSVLIETASRFVKAFYKNIASGSQISTAVREGQIELMKSSDRINIPGAGLLFLQDWFVPVLFQSRDFYLFESSQQAIIEDKKSALIPADFPMPQAEFVGRSRELLLLERLINKQSYVVIKGMAGIGKTALGIELAHWLIRRYRFDNCAFIKIESHTNETMLLNALGRQLVSNNFLVSKFGYEISLKKIFRALNKKSIIVLDNVDSISQHLINNTEILNLLQKLINNDSKLRMVFTTRESMPKPFNGNDSEISLYKLLEDDAKALFFKIVANENIEIKLENKSRSTKQAYALLDFVNGHPRSLILLAQLLKKDEIINQDNLKKQMIELHDLHPESPEQSLFASVEPSWNRLLPESQELLKGLAVFHDGSNTRSISMLLYIEPDRVNQLCNELIHVGLAHHESDAYIRFDPALPTYLSLQLKQEEITKYTKRWSQVISLMINYLYSQRFEDTRLQAKLTKYELPNLMAYIFYKYELMKKGKIDPEEVIENAVEIDKLLEFINLSRAREVVTDIRHGAQNKLSKLSHKIFSNEYLKIELLLEKNLVQEANNASERLLQKYEKHGKNAYIGVSYDIAMLHKIYGVILCSLGKSSDGLEYLRKAQEEFETNNDSRAAKISASMTLADQARCLRGQGKFNEALPIFEEAIRRANNLDLIRLEAVFKGDLANLYVASGEFYEALKLLDNQEKIFQKLNDVKALSVHWYKLGQIYRNIEKYEKAEHAFQNVLSIDIQQGDKSGEAATLNELASLYVVWNRPDLSLKYFRNSARIYKSLGDRLNEGKLRNNVAYMLMNLGQLSEARAEVIKSIECKKDLDNLGAKWVAWNTLCDIEMADGNFDEAQQARENAINEYSSYLDTGGESLTHKGHLCRKVGIAIRDNNFSEIKDEINELLDLSEMQKSSIFLKKLLLILDGTRNTDLIYDENLAYDSVAELKRLMKYLTTGSI